MGTVYALEGFVPTDGKRQTRPRNEEAPGAASTLGHDVRCSVCCTRIVMPSFVVLRGVLMCFVCERAQSGAS